tara:strand:- start:8905 stop:9120 length:216 start_codon:yes stop_codon:yes gene_type:complete
MQRLINAIDKATRAGVYTLEETAQILQAIDQVGAVVQQHNAVQENQKSQEPIKPPVKNTEVIDAQELKSEE